MGAIEAWAPVLVKAAWGVIALLSIYFCGRCFVEANTSIRPHRTDWLVVLGVMFLVLFGVAAYALFR